MTLRITVGSYSYDVVLDKEGNLRRPEQAPIEASERSVLRGKRNESSPNGRATNVVIEKIDG